MARLSKEEAFDQINKLLNEKLFYTIRKIIVLKHRDRFIKTSEYTESHRKKVILDRQYRVWYDSVSTFFLPFHALFALEPLVKRENSIREFLAEEVVRVKADYVFDDIEFSAFYPTHFNSTMTKEIEDCIQELKNPAYSHIVDSYIEKKDTERSPHEPLTNAELKYSCFYFYGFEPEYTTSIADILYKAELITDPDTNGWRISDDTVEEIITVLNSTYSEDKVLQFKRTFVDRKVDRFTSECIRPTRINSYYFPKKVADTEEFKAIDFKENRKLESDCLKVYELIFYMTLATQLKNSIYDTSIIEIVVGSKMLREQANAIIEGQENWELLTGRFMKRINSNSSAFQGNTVVLPRIEPETVLSPNDVYAYGYKSKRPPRYGVGRFITQILEKNGIGSNAQQDEIIKKLIASKAVEQIERMLYPQENAIILIEWLREFAPQLISFEYLYEIEDKVSMAIDGDITLSSILQELEQIIESAFEGGGFVAEDSRPSASKIKLVRHIALKHNLEIDESTYQSNAKLDVIIAEYPTPEPIKIGHCPNCNAFVYQNEYISDKGETLYYFSCENFRTDECTFSIWDSYIHKFFSDKAIELFTVEERADALKKIMAKKRGYLFTGFISKNKQPYDAKVLIDSYEDRKTLKEKWQFKLNFVNK